MENNFRIKLITNYQHGISGYEFVKHLMNKKFMHPTKESESDLIIKGYCINNNIYLRIQQNIEIYSVIDELLNELMHTFRTSEYVLDFDDVEHGFFNEFIYTGSILASVDNGKEKVVNVIQDMVTVLTDKEKKLDEYNEFSIMHNKILSNNYHPKEFNNYLVTFSRFYKKLGSNSLSRLHFSFGYDGIHTDRYSAQEHFKEIVKPIHAKLKTLGFKKKAFKFILYDKENNIEKEIWLQKHSFSRKYGLSFTMNFCINDENRRGHYFRCGYLVEPKMDRWFIVNISIDTEKTIEVLSLYIDKALEVLKRCNSRNELEEFMRKTV